MSDTPFDPDTPDDLALLDRYLAQEVTAAERARVDAWLVSRPDWRDALDAVQASPATGGSEGFIGDVEADIRRIRQEVSAGIAPAGRRSGIGRGNRLRGGSWWPLRADPFSKRPPRGRMLLGGMAGALMIVVALVTYWPSGSLGARKVMRRYTTLTGQHANVLLPDGSRMILAPQSSVDLLTGFGASHRAISLQGEAYFSVTSTANAPFIVRTGAITTRVLGTTFDVRQYADDPFVRVVVLQGKVVSGHHHPATLAAGMTGHITDSSVTTVMDDANALAQWTTGELVFDDEPVSTVLATLGRWYGYEFHLGDSTLATRRVRAVFKVAERAKTMAALANLLDVTMTMDHSRVILSARQNPHIVPGHNDVRHTLSAPMEAGK